MAKERLIELIDNIELIKSRFHTEKVTMFTSYDIHTGQRRSGGPDLEMIYKDAEFQKWRDEICIELSQLKQDEYIEELLRLLKKFSGLGDKSRFQNVESKLLILKDRIDEYIIEAAPVIFDDDRIPENELVKNISSALLKLQRNHAYNSSSTENIMNDYIRDILDVSYQVKDQTRQGDSSSGKDAGEIDVQICKDGQPIVMIEALILSSLNRQYLEEHINKVLTKYDPNGCPYTVLIIYATAMKFDEFYQKLISYLNEYDYPFAKETEIKDIDTNYTEYRRAQIILNRNGQNIRVHFMVVHIV